MNFWGMMQAHGCHRPAERQALHLMFPDTYDAQYLASFAADLENAHFKVIARGGICTDVVVERGSLWPKY